MIRMDPGSGKRNESKRIRIFNPGLNSQKEEKLTVFVFLCKAPIYE